MSLQLPWHSALVIGLGRSGRAAADWLCRRGCAVRGYDRATSIEDLPDGVSLVLGRPDVPENAFEGIDLLVLSPGLSPDHVLAQHAALRPEASVHGEFSLGLWAAAKQWPEIPTALITGTNGKSTVTSLLGHLLAAGGRTPFVGGNLGVPLCEHLVAVERRRLPPPDALVLECSSYQLETLQAHPTDVAMVLNISPDHLDRYPSMEAYADTKARVFADLRPGGLCLLDATDPWTPRLVRTEHEGEILMVGGNEPPRLRGEPPQQQLVVSEDETFERASLPLAGRHNATNALFAARAAREMGVSWRDCQAGLASFVGLPHRMEHVATTDDIAYYDDSKATNVASVLASLDGFERRFVLIAGGRAKGEDLSPLGTLLGRKARGLVAIGESAAKFVALAGDAVPHAIAQDMADAVAKAVGMAQPGDAVVLSPACASWDMYANYAERGQAFCDAVLARTDGRDV